MTRTESETCVLQVLTQTTSRQIKYHSWYKSECKYHLILYLIYLSFIKNSKDRKQWRIISQLSYNICKFSFLYLLYLFFDDFSCLKQILSMLFNINEQYNSSLSTPSSIKRFRIILQFSFIIFYTVFFFNFTFFLVSFYFKNYIEHEQWINECLNFKKFIFDFFVFPFFGSWLGVTTKMINVFLHLMLRFNDMRFLYNFLSFGKLSLRNLK